MGKEQSRRLKILKIMPDLIIKIFKTGNKKYFEIIRGVPKDAKVVDVQTDWNVNIDFLIESKEFEEVPEGADIPIMEPILVKQSD